MTTATSEGDRESTDLSDDKEEVPKELIISGLTSLEEDDRLQHLSTRTRGELIEKAKLLLSLNSVWRGPVAMNGSPSFFPSLANLEKDQITSFWKRLVKWNVSAPTGKHPRSAHTPWLLQQKRTRYHRI